jgi:hypothetical protein
MLIAGWCQQPGAGEGECFQSGEEEHDAMTQIEMTELEVCDYARQLFEAHGAKAIAEAAQKACTFEQQGDDEKAETWRHIEAALKMMRGPSVS